MVFADATRSSCLQPTFSSTTHDPAMFNNNNNYLPNLNQFGPPGQVPVSNVNTAQPTGSTVGPPPTSVPYQPLATFRFLSPTQGTAVPTWVPPASSVSVAAAPGMGVSWQHSVPSTMPWANHSPPNFNAEITPQAAVPSVPVPQQ
ncbi:hypothetical protein BaRGS_00027226 [Batillaria attramentaria]|uniref:Uncharacterized protein n=1 Tax=Batillaria attramentaria TaxID=370345 RepID=A0ABD0K441_9CAEN